jgi:hypothetical protein
MARIAAKKAELDRLRPVVGAGLANLEHIHDLELTYTSNAIEGNTLSAAETALVIEQGITIGGKPLKDHLEAIDLHEAIGYVRALARRGTPLTEADLRQLHHLVVQRSHPEIAGRYADDPDPRRLSADCRAAGGPASLCRGLARGTGRPRVGALRSSSLRAIGRDFGGIFERRQRGPPGPGLASETVMQFGAPCNLAYSAAADIATGSTLAAQNLYSGILPNGSSCGLVSTLAAASA